MGKNDTLFSIKDREPKKSTLSRGTYLYSPYMEVPPMWAFLLASCCFEKMLSLLVHFQFYLLIKRLQYKQLAN